MLLQVRYVSLIKYVCKMWGREMGWVKCNFGEKSLIIFLKNFRLYKIYVFLEFYYIRFS